MLARGKGIHVWDTHGKQYIEGWKAGLAYATAALAFAWYAVQALL